MHVRIGGGRTDRKRNGPRAQHRYNAFVQFKKGIFGKNQPRSETHGDLLSISPDLFESGSGDGYDSWNRVATRSTVDMGGSPCGTKSSTRNEEYGPSTSTLIVQQNQKTVGERNLSSSKYTQFVRIRPRRDGPAVHSTDSVVQTHYVAPTESENDELYEFAVEMCAHAAG